MAEDGREALQQSETEDGLQALQDVVDILDDDDFAAMAEGVLAVDDVSSEVVGIFHQDGKRRVNLLVEKGEHLSAVELAARCCSPSVFIMTCSTSFRVHHEDTDDVKAQIASIMADKPLLLAAIGGQPPTDEN